MALKPEQGAKARAVLENRTDIPVLIIEQVSRSLSAPAASLEFSGAFRVSGIFATAAKAAARCCQHPFGLRVVGLPRSPSLAFTSSYETVPSTCEGLPDWGNRGVGSTSGLALLTFASPSETHLCSLGSSPSVPRRASRRSHCTSRPVPNASLGVVQRSPLQRRQHRASTPGGGPRPGGPEGHTGSTVASPRPEGQGLARHYHRPGNAILRTRSVLVVPPDFDGLLCSIPCRSVAPCSRSWGSPRFGPAARPTNRPKSLRISNESTCLALGSSPRRYRPSKLSPRQQPYRVTAALAFTPLSLPANRRAASANESDISTDRRTLDLEALLH